MRRKLPRLHVSDGVYLRSFALREAPHRQELALWVPVHTLQEQVGSYLRTRDKRAFEHASKSQVRYFLLLVAEDIISRTT